MNFAHRKYKKINYNKSIKDIIKRMDVKMPINLANFDELIQELHILYPKKTELEIELIIRSFFKALRQFLIKNEIISFPNFLSLIFLAVTEQETIKRPTLQIKIITATYKKIKYWFKYEN